MDYDFPIILGMSSSQLTKSYFSEGLVYHQPVYIYIYDMIIDNNSIIMAKYHFI